MTKGNEPEGQAQASQEIALAELRAQQEAAIASLQAELAKAQEQIASHEQKLSEAQAKEVVENMEPTPQLDKTVKGGRYIIEQTAENPQGILVDANGNPIKE